MSSWIRRIANPQSRGAFGELAVENQLQSLGLEPGATTCGRSPATTAESAPTS